MSTEEVFMIRIRPALLTLAILGFAFSTAAQQPQRPVATIIKGATNPNQIPDEIAYRLYFFVLSNEAQETNFNMLKLSPSDRRAAIRIVNDFRTEDNRTRESQNSIAVAGKADTNAFREDRAALVENTRNKLRESLSPQGMLELDKAVQLNKHQIRLSVAAEPATLTPQTTKSAESVPAIQPLPCGKPTITWYYTTAETDTYSIATNSTSSQTNVLSNMVYDGSASANIKWGPDCVPPVIETPVYTPKIYNAINTTGEWVTGTVTTSGVPFNVGEVITYVIITPDLLQNQEGQYDGYNNGELNGEETTYGEDLTFDDFSIDVQFELAYERTAFSGTRTGCVYYPDTGATLCTVSTVPWCNPAGTPPDLNVVAVNGVETSPTPVPPFFENWAACWRGDVGGPWSCSPAFSLPNYNQAPGLGLCTKTP
jgi:hypothetical protein